MLRDDPWMRFVPAVVLVAFMATALPALLDRGPWYDEFYTWYAADPALGFVEAMRSRWLPDNHPPLFYALSWATAGLGETIELRRLVNLLALSLACSALWLLAHWRAEFRRWAIPYCIALASFSSAVEQVAQFRSNFLAYIAATVLAAALAATANPDTPQPRRREWLLLGASLMVAFNVHLTATLICGALGLAFGIWLVLRRDWQRAMWLALAGTIAALPFIAVLAMQFARMEANTRSFWIPAGLDAARWTIETEIVSLLSDNIALTFIGFMGAGVLVAAAWRERKLSPDLQLMAVLAGAGAIAIAVLLALHIWRPIVLGRYLVALAPVAGVALAVGATAILDRVNLLLSRAAAAVMLLLMALSLVSGLQAVRLLPSWDGTGREVGRIVAACPGALVHPALHWNAYTLDLPPADNRHVVPMAYRMTAARHGFALEGRQSRRMASECPTVFWAEHVAGQNPEVGEITTELRREGYAVEDARFMQIGDGWILLSDPATASATTRESPQ